MDQIRKAFYSQPNIIISDSNKGLPLERQADFRQGQAHRSGYDPGQETASSGPAEHEQMTSSSGPSRTHALWGIALPAYRPRLGPIQPSQRGQIQNARNVRVVVDGRPVRHSAISDSGQDGERELGEQGAQVHDATNPEVIVPPRKRSPDAVSESGQDGGKLNEDVESTKPSQTLNSEKAKADVEEDRASPVHQFANLSQWPALGSATTTGRIHPMSIPANPIENRSPATLVPSYAEVLNNAERVPKILEEQTYAVHAESYGPAPYTMLPTPAPSPFAPRSVPTANTGEEGESRPRVQNGAPPNQSIPTPAPSPPQAQTPTPAASKFHTLDPREEASEITEDSEVPAQTRHHQAALTGQIEASDPATAVTQSLQLSANQTGRPDLGRRSSSAAEKLMRRHEASLSAETLPTPEPPAPLPPPIDNDMYPALSTSKPKSRKGTNSRLNNESKPEPSNSRPSAKKETTLVMRMGFVPGASIMLLVEQAIKSNFWSENKFGYANNGSLLKEWIKSKPRTPIKPRIERNADLDPNTKWKLGTGQDANPEAHSYYASNGSAPLAKEKDILGKLFEKYRG
jgi:hypothetical protein